MPPTKRIYIKKKVYSNTVYIHIYYIPIKLATLTFLVRVCALELLRDARFKSTLKLELHPSQASTCKAAICASKPQHCQRALEATPLTILLRNKTCDSVV